MKELESPLKTTPDVQLIAEMQKEYTLRGKMKIKRGLILFVVFPYDNWAVNPVKIVTSIAVDFNNKNKTVKTYKAYQEPDGFYVWAINKETAVKKLKKRYLKAQEGVFAKKSKPLHIGDAYGL